jgi:hypothetical protein
MLRPPLRNGRQALDFCTAARFIVIAPGFRRGTTQWLPETQRALAIVIGELEEEAMFLVNLEALWAKPVTT